MLNPNHGICFAKIGQAAFNPAHSVPGIGPSPDQMLQGRLFFYSNKHRHRLDAPHMRPAVNQPHASHACSCSRESSMRTDGKHAREIRSHPPVHHRDDNSGQRDIGVSNANQF